MWSQMYQSRSSRYMGRSGMNVKEFKKNMFLGKLAEICSQQDKIEQGFSIISVGGKGFDYICAKVGDSEMLVFLVECKYNSSHLTKFQKKFQSWCKKTSLNFLVDRISPQRLQYWLDERGAI